MSTAASSHPRLTPEHGRHTRLRRVAAWIAAGLVALLVIMAIAVTVVLRSARFHNYILATVQKKASESLGAQVQLQNFVLHPSNLSLDLYGLTVHGAPSYPNPPLLQVAHAEVGVRVVSVLKEKWYLDSFVVDSPVVKIFTDAHGVTNIPTIKSSSSSSSNTSLFDLGIRHAVLDHGAVYYNNRQSVLSADLHNVDFRAGFDSLLQKYSGKLSYTDGHLVSGTFKAIPHNLDAEFDATPTTFHLTQAKLTSDSSQLVLTATLQDYSHPQVQAHYDAILDAGQFKKILENPSLPVGLIRTSGTVDYQEIANRPLLDTVVVKGDLNSNQLDVQTPDLRSQIRNIAAHYTLENGDATLSDFRASLLGGVLTSGGKMSNLSGTPHSKFNASLRGIRLADVNHAMKSSAVPKNIALGGVLNADADAAWGKTFDDVVAHADASIHASVSKSTAQVIPVESAIHGTYTAGNQQLALRQSYLRTPQSTLTMNGTVSERSSLDLKFQSNNLAELETIADLFTTSTQPLGLGGTALFQGTVRGSTSAPHLTGQLTASQLKVNGTEWRVLRTNVDVDPSRASLQHADLEPASRGKITFDASAGLHKWAFTENSPLHVNLNAAELDVQDLVKLSGQQVPVTGTLAANMQVHGTELSPIGQGKVSLTHVTAYDQPITSATLNFNGTGDEVDGDLGVKLPAGDVESKVSVRPRQKSYNAQLTASGIRLDQLQALQAQKIDAKGVVAIQAKGAGTFDNPQLDATLQIPQIDMQNQKIADVNLQMNIANHLATANLTSAAVGTQIKANAKVNLTGDYLADATLDTQTIPLQPIFAIYAPDQAADLNGQTEVHGTLHGPLKNQKLLEAHITIPTLKLAYNNKIQLAETAPIKVDYKDRVVTLQRSGLKGTDTDLQFSGSMSTASKDAPVSLLLLGTVNLQIAQLFEPDIRSSGELKFNINTNGATTSPNFAGEVDIVEANFASGDLPVGLQHGNGVLSLTKDRLNITKFQGTVGGGTVTAQGGVAYRPAIQFDLGLSANGVRALYPDGVRETVNANLRLAGTTDNAVLGGQVNLADLSFTPAFDLTSFINQFSGGVSPPPTPGISQNIQLNLGLSSENNINLVSRTLSINGSANLRVRGTAAQPVILGRVNLSGGDIILNGDRFVLNGGTIEFVNPSETEPVVNLALNTTIQQYNISMRFNGPIDQLRTNYASDPSLPAADIINLLAFGTTTEASAATSTPANQAAESLVASQVSSQVTSRVSKVAGISQLSINPVLAGGTSQGPPGANITIQQRVTGNLFVTFSSNVASTQNETIQGQYQLSPRVALSATRDQNGGVAVDTLIKKTW